MVRQRRAFRQVRTKLFCSGGDESETCSKSRTEAITFDIVSVGGAIVRLAKSSPSELGNVVLEDGGIEVVAVDVDAGDVVGSSFL